ncbi:hypothetical protein C7434_4097 [Pantoea sp. PNA 14-12]|nr:MULTISPECIES: hypothetical protein [Pantoea]MCU7367177.1 hypothetical protein [Pantoea stewartii]MDF7786860.1 hypothetical protein [Pantoea stewartii]MDK2635364.1 hypothetical protein [Pantoea stewartii subsp. indologenes]MEB6536821.1 hypothetical protein [Pantoea stewartii]TDS66340.1 hypothetical protein C7434_4097 [Pantoea sp. PNA 14-12]
MSQNPWVALIDSVEKKLIYPATMLSADRQRGERTQMDSAPGWFRCRGKRWINRLTKLSETLITSTTTGKQCSAYEECQQLLQQSVPTLQRLSQRTRRPCEGLSVCQQEETVAVALRAARKRR